MNLMNYMNINKGVYFHFALVGVKYDDLFRKKRKFKEWRRKNGGKGEILTWGK